MLLQPPWKNLPLRSAILWLEVKRSVGLGDGAYICIPVRHVSHMGATNNSCGVLLREILECVIDPFGKGRQGVGYLGLSTIRQGFEQLRLEKLWQHDY
jgi:hypothetical protein